jgi:hypothetical protein
VTEAVRFRSPLLGEPAQLELEQGTIEVADLTPHGCAAIIAGAIKALNLHDVTLVGTRSTARSQTPTRFPACAITRSSATRRVELDDCYSFTPEDQPVAVADAIAAFAGSNPPP